MSIGADSALNVATQSLDRVKQSASAHRRCFVVETMGRNCGFLALVSGLAAGAERVYLNEDGVDIATLEADVGQMRAAFAQGRRFYLVVRNEEANEYYTTEVLARLFEAESQGLYDVRSLILGHVQEGPNPSPFDRMTAARLASVGIEFLTEQLASGTRAVGFAGEAANGPVMLPLADLNQYHDEETRRPVHQWWYELRETSAKINERSFTDTPLGTAPGERAPGITDHQKFRG
jgi:6-phosphofructokinase 1